MNHEGVFFAPEMSTDERVRVFRRSLGEMEDFSGDLSIELIPAPGHHLDHIAAWISQLRLLLAFDAAEMPFPIMEDAAAVPLMISTLESFVALQPERVLCSHGKTSSPELVKDNLAYFREVERRCRASIQAGQAVDTEIEHAAELIGYPLDEVIAGKGDEIDRKFYGWAHDNNVRCMLEWLKREAGR